MPWVPVVGLQVTDVLVTHAEDDDTVFAVVNFEFEPVEPGSVDCRNYGASQAYEHALVLRLVAEPCGRSRRALAAAPTPLDCTGSMELTAERPSSRASRTALAVRRGTWRG